MQDTGTRFRAWVGFSARIRAFELVSRCYNLRTEYRIAQNIPCRKDADNRDVHKPTQATGSYQKGRNPEP